MKKKLMPLLLAVLLLVVFAASVNAAEDHVLVAEGDRVAAAAAAMTFPEDGSDYSAVCPVCSKTVTWKALAAETVSAGFTTAKSNTHYYLTGTAEGSGVKIKMYNSSSYTSCLHLNGKNLTNTSGVVFEGAAGKLNIMGSGIVKGKGSDSYGNAATVLMGNVGSINLYGGTYEKYAPASEENTVGFGWGGGTVAVYSGAAVKSGTAGSAVYMDNTMGSASATLNIYGGTIDGSATTARTVVTEAVADGRENYLTINLYGGTIQNGQGGNVILEANTALNMYGGTISGGNATNGGNVYVNTGAVFNLHGGTVIGGNATSNGGNVYVNTSGVMNMTGGTVSGTRDENGTATGGKAVNGGNIYLYTASVLNMTGGTVENGTADREGGNICAKPQYTEKVSEYITLHLENAVIRGGQTTTSHNSYGGGNLALTRVNATIGDGTQILDGVTAARGGNLRFWVGTIVMTGGKFSGGIANRSTGYEEIHMESNSAKFPSVLYMLGGVVEGREAEYGSVRVNDYSKLYLGGIATIMDNAPANSDVYTYNTGKLFICDGWTGSATAGFELDTPMVTGDDVSTSIAQVVTLDENRKETVGGSFGGKLKYISNGTQLLSKGDASGTLVVGGVTLVDSNGKKDLSADPLTAWKTGNYRYIQLSSTYTLSDLGGAEICIDLNGFNLTVGGSGTIHAFDSANDGYDATRCGTITVSGTAVVTPDVDAPNGNRYIALTNGSTTTLHRLEMRLTAISLRTTAAGLYYKAAFQCDTTLSAATKAYGVVFSLSNLPGDNFLQEVADNNKHTVLPRQEGFGNNTVATSGSIFNIMKDSHDTLPEGYETAAEYNAARGEMDIYANAYIALTDNTILVANKKDAGKTVDDQDFTGIALSLRDAMAKIDEVFYNYAESARGKLDSFFFDWQNNGMDWSFKNIGVRTVYVDNSNLSFTDGSNAYCPVCKKTVTWTAITQEEYGTAAAIKASNGKHYYLAEDIHYTAALTTSSDGGETSYFIRMPSAGNTACLHLNGHNLTAANNLVIQGYPGTLNVMGNGIVSGNRNNSSRGATIYFQTTGGTLNLYGGTYTKPAANTRNIIYMNLAGSVHVYEGAWIRGIGSSGYAAYLNNSSKGQMTFAVHGGKVTGGEVAAASATDTYSRNVIIDGNAHVEEVFIRDTQVNVNLSGSPVVDRLALVSNTKINVGTLTAGADITVSTSKVFTNASETVADSAKYIHPYVSTDAITVVDNTLRYDINYELYMTPYSYDVSAQAVKDGKMHYYFFSSNGMVMAPTNAGDIRKWGDTCLVVFPNGEEMLIDSGYAIQAPVLIGSLQRMGVGTQENPLDYLLITHPHNDHMGGAFSSSSQFLDTISVKQVYYDDYAYPDNTWVGVVETKCSARSIPYTSLKMGTVLTFGEDALAVTMTMLWPRADLTADELAAEDAENNHSMVFRFDYGEHSSLFTADIYGDNSTSVFDAETALLELYTQGELDADLMKVPHHGLAKSSSTLNFLQAVTPEIAVVTGYYEMMDEVVTRYTSTDSSKGVGATLLQDRYTGYIHISAGTDGNMTTETEK